MRLKLQRSTAAAAVAVAANLSCTTGIILYIASNVVFYSLSVKATTQFFLAKFYFCFAFVLKGLVCKLAVEHQIRYIKRVDVPADVVVQVVSLVLGEVVYPW